LFERFLSDERKETPDIDIDFAHRDREKVIQYVYEKYGREHAGMVCEFITYRGRSAVRDVGKALGLSLAQVERAAAALEARRAAAAAAEMRALAANGTSPAESELGIDLAAPRARHLIELVEAIDRFPRHLSIHVGGMVITERPLSEVVPLENAALAGRTVIQWDKDDLAQLGIIKIDLLGLGMLTAIQDAIKLVKEHEGKEIDLARLGCDDPRVYDMLCRADTIGVFQVESRAQMNTLPRLKPRGFYDLVVEVALIRPGPIQGEMVHPYLRRRAGQEKVVYPHPSLEPILKRTLGVPLFQEQGMKLAVAAAGFSAGEADELRRAMGHKRSHEQMERLAERLLAGMMKNGIPAAAAARIFKQLAAFADYGFPESHAASFALLVYASAYLKRYHHAAFSAALLNAQPMGFYSPATLIHDARRHGVEVRPIDARHSRYDCTLEQGALRLGLCHVRGAGEGARAPLEKARAERPFASLEDFVRRSGLPRAALENLALIGGFRGFGLEPRPALWQVQALARRPQGPLASVRPREPAVALPALSEAEATEADYALAGLSASRQPLSLFRSFLDGKKVVRAADLERAQDGRPVRVAGLVICRQHPPTAKGFAFLTLEDETGIANVVVRPDLYAKERELVRRAPLLVVDGVLEKASGVINVRAERFYRLGTQRAVAGHRGHDFR
ncbi:MAG: error-prone DNA polymerase, partial [Planctomycetes bacterium]|nr:error-prone DNA polymerase [Planctomycetota bacterium]